MKGGDSVHNIEKIKLAQIDEVVREQFIEENMSFICSCAAKVTGRFVDRHDDACSVAMIAFNDAITAYNQENGDFRTFASIAIRNRIIDQFRKESRNSACVLLSELSVKDDDGREHEFEIEDPKAGLSDAAIEIEAVKQELSRYNIDFFDLPKVSPKVRKTKKACMDVVKYLLKEPELLKDLSETKCLPGNCIIQAIGTSRKILERHRKYIIAGIIICSGEYPIMKGYFDSRREVQ